VVEDKYRATMICIDSYQSDRFQGRIYNSFMSGAVGFEGLMQMLLKMDCLLDEIKFPQSFVAKRKFSPAEQLPVTGHEQGTYQGKLATFAVRVLFRQNASWQGSVTWLEGGRDESFRSVLELLFLMNSALESGKL